MKWNFYLSVMLIFLLFVSNQVAAFYPTNSHYEREVDVGKSLHYEFYKGVRNNESDLKTTNNVKSLLDNISTWGNLSIEIKSKKSVNINGSQEDVYVLSVKEEIKQKISGINGEGTTINTIRDGYIYNYIDNYEPLYYEYNESSKYSYSNSAQEINVKGEIHNYDYNFLKIDYTSRNIGEKWNGNITYDVYHSHFSEDDRWESAWINSTFRCVDKISNYESKSGRFDIIVIEEDLRGNMVSDINYTHYIDLKTGLKVRSYYFHEDSISVMDLRSINKPRNDSSSLDMIFFPFVLITVSSIWHYKRKRHDKN